MKKLYILLTFAVLLVSNEYLLACTITLVPGTGQKNQTVCVNTPISTIKFKTLGATAGSVSSLPAGVTYSWSADTLTIIGAPTVTGLYTYTVSLNGCTQTSTGTITSNATPVASITNNTGVTKLTCLTTAINLTATGGGTYLWNSGSTIANQLITAGGTYTVTVTNANLCTATASINITVDTIHPTAGIITSTGTTTLTCQPPSMDLIASGGGNYLWNGGATISSLTINTAGVYTVTVTTPTNGCTQSSSLAITANNNAPTVNAGATFTKTCIAFVTGNQIGETNAAGNSYLWTASNTLTGLSSTIISNPIANPTITTTYTVTKTTTANGCTATASVIVNVDTVKPSVSTLAFPAAICSGGSSTIIAFGATNYSWSTGQLNVSSISVNPTTSTTYTVTGTTSSNGCTKSASFVIAVNPLPNASISPTGNVNVSQNGVATIIFTGSGGTKPYTFSYILNGGSTQTITTSGNSTSASISVPTGLIASYSYKLISVSDSNGCAKPKASITTINIISGPYLTNNKQDTICDNSLFTYTATTSVPVSGISWSRAAVNGISPATNNGTNASVNEILDNSTAQAIDVYYVFSLVNGAGDTFQDSITVTINPTPTINAITDTSFCNEAAVIAGLPFSSSTIGAEFNWSNSNTNIGLPANGNGNIPAFIPTNTSSSPITGTIKVWTYIKSDIDTCKGDSLTFTITVLPTPVLTSVKTKSVCDNEPFTYNLTSSTTGASFYWVRQQKDSITPAPGTGSASALIQDTLHNLTAQPIDVKYILTIYTSSSGCSTTDTLTLTVNPTPAIDSIPDVFYCNNVLGGNIPFASISPNAAFTWSNSNTNIGLAASGGGNKLPAFNTVNNGTQPVNAIVTVYIKASSDSCIGISKNFTITVLPAPYLTSTVDTTICDGLLFNYTAASLTPNLKYTWVRDAVIGINNGTSGNGSSAFINEVLDNTTDSAIIVYYKIKMVNKTTADSCSVIQNLKVTVLPTATLNSYLDTVLCNNSQFVYVATSLTPGISYKWYRGAVAGINTNLPDSGQSFTINNILTNSTNSIQSVNYQFTLSNSNGCENNNTVTVNVFPTPTLLNTKLTDTICNNEIVSFIPTSTDPTVTYSWIRNAIPGINGDTAHSGNGAIINDALTNSTNLPIDVNYSITLTDSIGCNNIQNYNVKVLPIAKLSSAKNFTLCNGNIFSYQATSATPSLGYSWTRASVMGINSNNPGAGNDSIINEALINSDAQIHIVKYVFQLKSLHDSTCIDYDTVTVFVFPTPVLTSSTVTSICDNEVLNYSATSSTNLVTFSWVRASVAGINNSTSGSGSTNIIQEALDNTTSFPIVVNYVFTLSVDPLHQCFNTQYLSVTVNPTPVIDPIPDQYICNGETSLPITFSSITPNAKFKWTNGNTNNGLADSMGYNFIPSFTAINNDTVPIQIKITVDVKASSDSCAGTAVSFKFIVNPIPKLVSLTPDSICSGTNLNGVIQSNFSNGVTYIWVSSTLSSIVSGYSNQTANLLSNNIIDDTLTIAPNQYSIEKVFYNIKLTYTNQIGCSSIYQDTVFVKPSPPVPKFTSIAGDTLCLGSGNINFNIINPLANTGYNWSINPTVTGNTIWDLSHPNTVISFNASANYIIKNTVTMNPGLGSCQASDSQKVVVSNTAGIDEQRIFLKQPGNLLIYPDNSMDINDGYQWGYDTIINSTATDTILGLPHDINGQVYQFFIPAARFIDAATQKLNVSNYCYWVLLTKGECKTKVYYNGPYAHKPIAVTPVDNTVQLNVIPNPSNGTFSVALQGNIYGNIEAVIFNSIGKQVYQNSFEKQLPVVSHLFDLNTLPNGLYYLELNSSDLKKMNARILIQH